MTTTSDLEAQLREGLDRGVDRDIVVVYADLLQAEDDPRGELIVVDLEIEHSGETPALTRRRNELIDAWLGGKRPNGAIRYGFVDLDATSAEPIEQIRTAFASKAARFTRSVTVVGPPKHLGETVASITEAPRPFLSRLTIRQWSESARATVTAPDLARLTNLQCLEIDARNMFGRVEHPTLRRLRLSGHDAIRKFDLPSVVELDFAMQCHLASDHSEAPAAVFEQLGQGMPKLTTLDLSRNEPGYLDPHTLGGTTKIFDQLVKLHCRTRLEKLVLPPPPAAALTAIRDALKVMPALRELAFPRVEERSLLVKNFARHDLTLTFPG